MLKGKDHVKFQVGDYDPDYPLIIDPVIVYCTYLGGSGGGWEGAYGIAVDNEGCAYVTGYTLSTDFPRSNAYQNEIAPDQWGDISSEDVFVTKFNAEGNDILYSTYVGGGSSDQGYAIAVDLFGNAHVTGKTQSRDASDTPADEGFPYRNEFRKCEDSMGDAFVFTLSAAGNDLLYASCIGGGNEDEGRDIDVDLQGNCYITGMHQPEVFGKDFPKFDVPLS